MDKKTKKVDRNILASFGASFLNEVADEDEDWINGKPKVKFWDNFWANFWGLFFLIAIFDLISTIFHAVS